jgi:lysophospholipase L1-like esterase
MTPAVLLVLLPVLGLVFVLAELGARAWLDLRGQYFVWAPGARTLQVLDPDAMPGLPSLARFEINRDGERGDEPPEESWDAYRVLVLGGSSTECRFIDQREAWPAVAQRFLSRPDSLDLLHARRAHVGNLGRSLATCGQLRLVLERVLPRYERLDAIVLMVGASDVVEWLARGAPPEAVAVPIATGDVFDEHPEGPFGWTPGKLALRRILASWRRSLLGSLETHRNAGRGVARARRMRAQATEVIDVLPDAAGMLGRFEESFRALLHAARAKAGSVVVLRPCWARGGPEPDAPEHGWMFADGDLRSEPVQRWYSQRVADRLLEMVERRMSAIVRELGLPEIDPKLLVEAGPAHFYDAGHLTPAGCEILGQAVAQAVLRERRGRFSSRLRAVDGERHADVA